MGKRGLGVTMACLLLHRSCDGKLASAAGCTVSGAHGRFGQAHARSAGPGAERQPAGGQPHSVTATSGGLCHTAGEVPG